jgi:uncharacterized membrane protein
MAHGLLQEWLVVVTEMAVLGINAMALIVILFGTAQAFFAGLPIMFGITSPLETREVWMRYGRWLIAGLTFQLGADIIETSISPGWEDIGRLAAIAAIRTALNYFLERDLVELRRRSSEAVAASSE